MEDGFREGYDYFQKNAGSAAGAFAGYDYVDAIQTEVEELVKNLNQFNGFDTAAKQLKGDVAEYWHSGTFNVNAAVKGSSNRSFVDRSHDLGSTDVSTNWGDKIGLKYYSNAKESAKQQAKSVFEKYKEYQSNNGKDTLDEYLSKRGYSSDSVINDPLYNGQVRLIPRDQLEEATNWLKRRISEEAQTRPDQVKRYQDTLDLLSDRIRDNNGSESIPLSKDEAENLARIAKEGNINAEELGLTTEELIKVEYILKQAFKAGLTAATISCVLKTAPEVIKAISYLVQTGEIDEDSFKKIGAAAVAGAGEGFVKGTIAAALTSCCKSGLLGNAAKDINPSVIGALTVIAFDTIINACEVAHGNKTRYMLSNELVKELYVSAWSLGLGTVSQGFIEIPVLGFMLGSFIGSAIGSFTYAVGDKVFMSFCIDTGFTMFGLVEQNYELPADVLKDIGIDVFEYETFTHDEFTYDEFVPDKFTYEEFIPDSIDITFLRRGVIGIGQIGYT